MANPEWDRVVLALVVEGFAVASTLINVLAIAGVLYGDFMKQSARVLFTTTLLTNAVGSLSFSLFVGPNFLIGDQIFPFPIYTVADALGSLQWNMTAWLSAIMAVERLLILFYPTKAATILQTAPMFALIALVLLFTSLMWTFLCRTEFDAQQVLEANTFRISFPRGISRRQNFTCAIVGMSIDSLVTTLCTVCYSVLYYRMRKLNNSSCCLLSERALYRRRQREFKVACEFCISCLIYVVCWVTARLVKPQVEDEVVNRPIFALFLIAQQMHAAITGLLSLIFFQTLGIRRRWRAVCKKMREAIHSGAATHTVPP